ncbi:radical SAM protein [archaeon]|nr:radical SAM protein [archaeon]NCP79118.1 radical SAM protein [archaeon]NCP97936.1 radical SAM protein [archaeon]NCQ06885.1 radical SAM protein [archaeon]NCQ50681.1 radical SAM protein [archaeon]
MQMNESSKYDKMKLYVENAKNNSIPTDAYLQVNFACNAKCVMCNIWKNPYMGEKETLLSIINKLSDLNFKWVTLWGGEPLLHPNIDDLIIHAKNKNLKVQIITNGSLLNNHVDVVSNFVDNLVVSIDSGFPEIHDKIRNLPRNF